MALYSEDTTVLLTLYLTPDNVETETVPVLLMLFADIYYISFVFYTRNKIEI